MSARPRLLDLFSGAGGSAVGYHRAGFDVVGVDIAPQPNYPFRFHEGDALCFLNDVLMVKRTGLREVTGFPFEFDAIHASPPCQRWSTTRTLHDYEYPDLLTPARELILATGLPYVIENVAGAPLMGSVKLCDSSFGLGVRRHRFFEANWMIWCPPECRHDLQPEPIDVTGTGARRIGEREDGAGGNSRKPRNLGEAREAMGIDWMRRRELSEAIPPAYTEFIGHQLLASLEVSA